MKKIAILILAAGASSRFGGCKLLAQVDGRAMLASQIDLACRIAPENVYIVTGAWYDEIKSLLNTQPNAKVIYNPDWQQGMSSSLKVGISQLTEDYTEVMVLLADQVNLSEARLRQLITAFDGENIVCGFYEGRRGVPAIFGASHFEEIMQLSGDQGAKPLLYDTNNHVVECAMPEASIDIDTPEQLLKWHQTNI